MPKRTPAESAALIALLFERSGQRRARISTATLETLSGRKPVRNSFVARVQEALSDEFDLVMHEVDRGFGLLPFSSLDGAPAITPEKYFQSGISQKVRLPPVRRVKQAKNAEAPKEAFQAELDGEIDFAAVKRQIAKILKDKAGKKGLNREG